MADTRPQLHPALLRLSAMISQYFARRILPLSLSMRRRQNDNEPNAVTRATFAIALYIHRDTLAKQITR
jgi:hypothetical protein